LSPERCARTGLKGVRGAWPLGAWKSHRPCGRTCFRCSLVRVLQRWDCNTRVESTCRRFRASLRLVLGSSPAMSQLGRVAHSLPMGPLRPHQSNTLASAAPRTFFRSLWGPRAGIPSPALRPCMGLPSWQSARDPPSWLTVPQTRNVPPYKPFRTCKAGAASERWPQVISDC
jgi:hypothetical protein